ncbi:hypothetical protein F4808DRAFT_436338 [Astrocystis sublimbata]|nr:hypothetical protein F4808DRAFT_436338 [Astrocystis sublimbata]
MTQRLLPLFLLILDENQAKGVSVSTGLLSLPRLPCQMRRIPVPSACISRRSGDLQQSQRFKQPISSSNFRSKTRSQFLDE